MGKAYIHGGRTAIAANAEKLAGHGPEWYERPNPNLLINGDFRGGRLINQRGQTEYTGKGYAIDGWRSYDDNVTIKTESDGVVVQTIADADSSNSFCQLIGGARLFEGKQMTETFLISDLTPDTFYARARFGTGETNAFLSSVYSPVVKEPGIVSLSYTVPLNTDFIQVAIMALRAVHAGDHFKVQKAKLELGDHFTGWNETDPGEELHQCQRYGFALDAFQRFRASRVASGQIDFAIPCPVPLRATPLLPRDMSVVNLAGVGQQGYTFSVMSIRSGLLIIRAAKLNHGLSDALLQMSGEGVSYFDANL